MLAASLHSLARGLARRSWLVALATIIVCAAFAAQAVAALAEADVLPPATSSQSIGTGSHPPLAARSSSTRVKLDGADLVARNMFCSTCEVAVATPGPAGLSFSGRAAILIATSIGRESRATVRVPETEVQGDWGLGDRIPGVGTIDRIGAASVDVVDAHGARTTLRLLELPAADRPRDAATSPRDPPPAADPFADRIKKIDDKTYEVDRDLVRELVSAPTKAGKVRMLPIVSKDGEVGGVRVYGVTPGSLPAKIGLRSSDVIDSINGEPIKSAQQLLDLYAMLDKLDAVELGGKRAGKPLTVDLRLR